MKIEADPVHSIKYPVHEQGPSFLIQDMSKRAPSVVFYQYCAVKPNRGKILQRQLIGYDLYVDSFSRATEEI